jgi:hypothetical protein
MKNFKQTINKEIQIMDAKTTIKTVAFHSLINFIYGVLSGIMIATTSLTILSGEGEIMLKNFSIIGISYYVFKRFDSIVINRKYETKLGRDYIFPIPSTFGFMLGCYITALLKNSIL